MCAIDILSLRGLHLYCSPSDSLCFSVFSEPLCCGSATQGELRPLENFNVALTYGVSVERALGCTLDGTNSSAPASVSKQLPLPPSASTAVKTQRRKTSSVVSNTRSTSRASRHPTQSQAQTQTQTQTEDSTTEDKSKGTKVLSAHRRSIGRWWCE